MSRMASWSKTDWIVVVSFFLIAAAMALYCLQFYCCRFSDASPTDRDLLIDDITYDYECPLPPSASAEPSPSRSRSEIAKARQLHPSPMAMAIGWSRPPDWESHRWKSESEYHSHIHGNAQPTPFFIDIPNEQFLREVSNRDVISS